MSDSKQCTCFVRCSIDCNCYLFGLINLHFPHTKLYIEMSEIEGDHLGVGLERLVIDDNRVNEMQRRRSIRIQAQVEKRLSQRTFFDIANNNIIEEPRSKSSTEFELETKNDDYQNAISKFTLIEDNVYIVKQRKKSIIDHSEPCDCTINRAQILRGEIGCGTNCLNRVMCIECNSDCPLGRFCGNQQFQRRQNTSCTIFMTEMKGFGLFASTHVPANTFIIEYVGEVVSLAVFKKRAEQYKKNKLPICYVMKTFGNNYIDATKQGNLARFINHSCDANAETQKVCLNRCHSFKTFF